MEIEGSLRFDGCGEVNGGKDIGWREEGMCDGEGVEEDSRGYVISSVMNWDF